MSSAKCVYISFDSETQATTEHSSPAVSECADKYIRLDFRISPSNFETKKKTGFVASQFRFQA